MVPFSAVHRIRIKRVPIKSTEGERSISNVSCVTMSTASQKRRSSSANPLSSRRTTKTSRTASVTTTASITRMVGVSRSAANSSSLTADPAPPAETIDVLDSSEVSEDVVDLTCEGLEPSTFVDLTSNDSVVLLDEGPQTRASGESYVVSSDDEEDLTTVHDAALLSSLQASSQARAAPGTISCPVCMDAYTEIVDSGRLVVSTKCGHIFCSQCLRDALSCSHSCPTCRKKLTHRQYHPIYI